MGWGRASLGPALTPQPQQLCFDLLFGEPIKNALEKDSMTTEKQKNNCFRHVTFKLKSSKLQNL